MSRQGGNGSRRSRRKKEEEAEKRSAVPPAADQSEGAASNPQSPEDRPDAGNGEEQTEISAPSGPAVQPPPADPADGVSITLPLGRLDGYVQRHIDVRLDVRQSRILNRLYHGLNDRDRRLANDRHVTSTADVIRYMLERVAAEEEKD